MVLSRAVIKVTSSYLQVTKTTSNLLVKISFMTDNPFFFQEFHEHLRVELASFTAATTELWDGDVRAEAESITAEYLQAKKVIAVLANAGLLRLVVPAAYGGRLPQVDLRSICLAREQLAFYSALADLMLTMQGLGSYPITLAGSEALKNQYLPAVAQGKLIAAFALTEPEAGSDVAGMQTTAVLDGDDLVLNGQKIFISNAGIADFYTVFAKTDPSKGNKGISAVVVDANTPGVMVRPMKLIAPHPIGEVMLENCRVPKTHLLGELGGGIKIALGTLDTFRASVGALALGLAQRALTEAQNYTQTRHQFGRPLREFQAIQIKLADMATALEAARLLVYRAAWLKDQGQMIKKEAAMAKLFATEAAQKIIDEAVQIFGGRGLIQGVITERLYRDIRATRIYEGTSEIQKFIIANELFKN
jgi:acyl-CoA dehydrogenase